MSKNYFTDSQVKEALEKLGMRRPFSSHSLQHYKNLMNLAVETAIGEPYLHVDYSKIQNVNWIKVNNCKDNTPLYSIKELDN